MKQPQRLQGASQEQRAFFFFDGSVQTSYLVTSLSVNIIYIRIYTTTTSMIDAPRRAASINNCNNMNIRELRNKKMLCVWLVSHHHHHHHHCVTYLQQRKKQTSDDEETFDVRNIKICYKYVVRVACFSSSPS